MILRSTAKLVIAIALLGLVAVELGSPLVARVQLDGLAHDVADDTAHEIQQRGTPLQTACETVGRPLAASKNAELILCQPHETGAVRVTVERQAWSLLLAKWDTTRSWYQVQVSATGGRTGG